MMWSDVRFAVRTVARRPGLAITVALTLALGVGANVAVFSIGRSLLWRQLPVADPSSLVQLVNARRSGERWLDFSYPVFRHLAEQRDGLVALMAFAPVPLSASVDGEPGRLEGEIVTGEYFQVLGVVPQLGRLLDAADDREARPAVVLSHTTWQRRFAGAATVIGRTVRLNSHAFTVVGVAPRGFTGLGAGDGPDLWVPMGTQPIVSPGEKLGAAGWSWLTLVGRLRLGTSAAAAGAALTAIERSALADDPDADRGSVEVIPARRLNSDQQREAMRQYAVLQAVALLVLAIACANVSGLLLARGAGRRREMAIRLAVGGTGRRLVRQLVAEGAVLGLVAVGLGIALASPLARLLCRLLGTLPLSTDALEVTSGPAFAVSLVLGLASSVAASLLPARQAVRTDLTEALKQDTRAGTGRARARALGTVVVAQVALSFVLLAGAGLLVRTLLALAEVPPGFTAAPSLVFELDPALNGYDEQRTAALFSDLLSRLRAIPGVAAATTAFDIPLDGWRSRSGVKVAGHEPPPGQHSIQIETNVVASGYLDTLGVPLIAGRAIDERDGAQAPTVAVINQAMAARFWAGAQPVGKTFEVGGKTAEVVGIVADGKYRSLRDGATPYMLLSAGQFFMAHRRVVVRSELPRATLEAAVRACLREVDPDLPMLNVTTLRAIRQRPVARERSLALVAGSFAALALALSALGLFGVISYTTAQRTREIGLRMALGAAPARIAALVGGQAFALLAAGVGIGLGGALLAARLLRSYLFGVGVADPPTLAAAVAVLLAVTVLAAWLPARRAAAIDPAEALRSE